MVSRLATTCLLRLITPAVLALSPNRANWVTQRIAENVVVRSFRRGASGGVELALHPMRLGHDEQAHASPPGGNRNSTFAVGKRWTAGVQRSRE